MLNETEFFATVVIKILYMIYGDFIMLEIDNFRVLQQLLIPGLAGGIGGLSLMLMASLSDYGEFSLKEFHRVYIKLIILGGIAGVAAVNLLNPGGDISQVMVLGLIAGLSGFSYLKRSSLVEGIHEDAVLKGIKNKAYKEVALVLEGSKTEVELEDEVVETEVSTNYDENESDDKNTLNERDNDSEVDEYIDNKVREWKRANPDATPEEVFGYYDRIVEEVIANTELIDLEE